MANQRGIVAGWDTGAKRPKGVQSAADLRTSLGMIARGEGIMSEPGAASVTRPATSMRINWTAFTAVIKSPLGGWYCPRIDAGGINLAIGDSVFPRVDVVWVKQNDYQVDASRPNSEVQIGVASGTPSATPSTPGIPTGALAAFTITVPKGATRGVDIDAKDIRAAVSIVPAGGIATAANAGEANALYKTARGSKQSPFFVWRSDLKALRITEGSGWKSVPEDTGWQPVKLSTGWSAVYPVAVRREGSVVTLKGLIKRDAGGSLRNMLQLPEGFAPTETLLYNGAVCGRRDNTGVDYYLEMVVASTGLIAAGDGYGKEGSGVGVVVPVGGTWMRG